MWKDKRKLVSCANRIHASLEYLSTFGFTFGSTQAPLTIQPEGWPYTEYTARKDILHLLKITSTRPNLSWRSNYEISEPCYPNCTYCSGPIAEVERPYTFCLVAKLMQRPPKASTSRRIDQNYVVLSIETSDNLCSRHLSMGLIHERRIYLAISKVLSGPAPQSMFPHTDILVTFANITAHWGRLIIEREREQERIYVPLSKSI